MIGKRAAAAAVALFVFAAAVTWAVRSREERPVGVPILVVSAPDAPTWVELLRSHGMPARVGTLTEMLDRRQGVVPAQTRLTSAQRDTVVDWVEAGGRAVTAHERLLDAFGFGRLSAVEVADVEMRNRRVVWPAAAMVEPLLTPASVDEEVVVAQDGDAALATAVLVDQGRLLALGVDPVADFRFGYELMPWLPDEIARALAPVPGPQRIGVEVYFDPGLLDADEIDEVLDDLANVRAVHIAGWNVGFRDEAANFDYGSFIDELHARGILAYAWLAPPFVSLRFWEDHVGCRERTESGREAKVFWRSLIALEDTNCFELAWDQVWEPLLRSHDWDGVNVAELYFESSAIPADHTPFHPTALERFGGDPAADPAGFARFRTDLVTELNDAMLKRANGLPGAADLDFQLTVIDDHLDPEVAGRIATSVAALAKVAQANGATLQVEDPFTQWASTPRRYEQVAETVRDLMPPLQSILDVNVVDRAGATPTSKMTGAELDIAVSLAAKNGRVAVYAAGTLAPADLRRLPAVAAGSVATFDTGLRADWTVRAMGPSPDHGRLDVDGKPWPASAGMAMIPAGEHRLAWSDGESRGPGLVRFTAEIGDASVEEDALSFDYDALHRPIVMVDRPVRSVEIDGRPVTARFLDPKHKVVQLPEGTHTARLRS